MSEDDNKNCSSCRGLDSCKNIPTGHRHIINYYDDGTPTSSWFKCELEEQRISKIKMKTFSSGAGIGRKFSERTFEAYNKKRNPKAYESAIEYVNSFSKSTEKGLMFIGPVGTGKTHLAAAVLLEVMKKGVGSKYLSAPDAEIKYASSWQERDTRKLIDSYCQSDILVLDDLGKEKNTDSTKTLIYHIVNSRYENSLPTIITTNLNRNMIKSRYGDAVFSRLNEMCSIITMTGEDYRMSK